MNNWQNRKSDTQEQVHHSRFTTFPLRRYLAARGIPEPQVDISQVRHIRPLKNHIQHTQAQQMYHSKPTIFLLWSHIAACGIQWTRRQILRNRKIQSQEWYTAYSRPTVVPFSTDITTALATGSTRYPVTMHRGKKFIVCLADERPGLSSPMPGREGLASTVHESFSTVWNVCCRDWQHPL